MYNEMITYMEEHLESLQDELEHNVDSSDYEWYNGAIETLEHLLAKFGGNVNV